MRRKSVAGFVLGLIGGIFTTVSGACYTLCIGATNEVIKELSEGVSNMDLFVTLSWCMFLGGILAIVGASLCFKQTKIGGIFLLIATAMTAALTIYEIMQLKTADIKNTTTTYFIFALIPSILMLIGGIMSLCAKPKQVAPTYPQQPQAPMPPQAPQQ